MVSALFAISTYAGKPEPQTQTSTVASSYVDVHEIHSTNLIMSVPGDKQFVLTDILVSVRGKFFIFEIMEEDTVKAHIRIETSWFTNVGVAELPRTRSYHFASGIPFSPGTNINIYHENGEGGHVTISGYEIDI